MDPQARHYRYLIIGGGMTADTVSDWQDPYRKGVVCYLLDGRVRCVLLWNVWGQVDAARRLIEQAGPFRLQDLRGRIATG